MASRFAGLMLIMGSVAVFASAGFPVPEVDPGQAVSAGALIAGVLLVMRAGRKK